MKKIIKFGGSTLLKIEDIKNVLSIIKQESKENDLLVVMSALGGITDMLTEVTRVAAKQEKNYINQLDDIFNRHETVVKELFTDIDSKQIINCINTLHDELKDTLHGVYLVKELSLKTLDFILSFGERLSALIITNALQAKNVSAEYTDTRNLFCTDDQFGKAKINESESKKKIKSYFSHKKNTFIVPGFIGSTACSETTTLGRGNSDLTATFLAATLNADMVELWTNVDGIMSADPRKVSKAIPIEKMSYVEALELSHFGAKIIRPAAVHPIVQNEIPMRIRNINNRDFPGTMISNQAQSNFLVKGISSIDQIALLRLQGSGMMGVIGIANRLFSALAKKDINVILITQASSEHSICIAVSPENAGNAKKAIEEEFTKEISAGLTDQIIIEKDVSIIAIVGDNMRATPGISGRVFQALGKNGINVMAIAQGSSERNISVVIPKTDESKALNALHDTFFLSDTKTIHLYVVGTGLIGGTLLDQIDVHANQLLQNNAMEIRISGIGDIDKMQFDEQGLDLSDWRNSLKKSNIKMDLDKFVKQMFAMNLSNSIFIDATGSTQVVEYYENIFKASISIVTPNKIANSGDYKHYKKLHDCVTEHGVKFLYETNVGAGLPVISTLNDLLISGDKILTIEGVFSGTLSFIFNSFTKGKKFSNIVREAKEKGFSEPDPRDDLNGKDVARKILILARECGYAMEPEDIKLDDLLSESCKKAKSIDAFLQELIKSDEMMEKRRAKAEAEDKILRYIARLENGKATVSLTKVDQGHPFVSLSGSDNMIIFTTERYQKNPLVIRGPGAGAQVTAAGVFADLIRIANYLS